MSEHGRTRAHVYISGHVQGAYYRVTTHDTTRDRGVDGWVKDLSDDHVETTFKGPHDGIEAMVEWCHERSPMMVVGDVDITLEEPGSETGFRIER